MIRKIIFFAFIVFLWFIPLSFISFNSGYCGIENQSLITLIILWIINILLLSISVFNMLKEKSTNNQYLFILITHYLVNPLFPLFFFNFKNISLAIISLIIIFISSIYLFSETKKLDRKSSKWIIPYLVWNIYLIITILYVLNI